MDNFDLKKYLNKGILLEADEKDLEKSFKKDVTSFKNDLSTYMTDPKVSAVLKAGLADGDLNDDKLPYTKKPEIAVKKLIPTQSEIGFDQSIQNLLTDQYGSLESILQGKANVGGPIVTYAGKYIIDGHHRWSQVFAGNTNATMEALDIKPKSGYQPTDILKAVHGAIAVELNKVPASNPEGINIMTGVNYEGVLGKVTKYLTDDARKIWAKYGFDSDEKIAKHLYKNLKNIVNNGHISAAPGRIDMPQTDGEETKTQDKLDALSKGEINIAPPFATTNENKIKLTSILKEVIKDKKNKSREIEIDLTGPDGNAYVLLGYAKEYAKQLNLPWDKIQDEMTSSDYENLVNTFDKYFGSFITLYR